MIKFLAGILLATLLVAGCDTARPDADDLVGSWTFVSVTSSVLATVSQAQAIPDFQSPGVGGVQVAGAETGTLRFTDNVYREAGGYESIGVYSAPAVEEGGTFAGLILWNDPQSGFDGQLYVLTPDRAALYNVDSFDGPRLYTLAGNQITVHNAALSSASGARVTARGTLALAMRNLAAGREASVASETLTAEPESEIRYVFEAGGVFLLQEVEGAVTRTTQGRWRALGGDRLEVDVNTDGVSSPQVLTYRIEGRSTLRLTFSDADGCDAQCLRTEEAELGLQPNTLTRLRYESVFAFARTGAAARAEAPPEARLPLPERLIEARRTRLRRLLSLG